MHCVSACLLALFVVLAVGNDYELDNSFEIDEIPKNAILVPIGDFSINRPIRRRSVTDDFNKRSSFNQHEQLAIPRGGAMITGRGWMPGFAESPRLLFKRSIQLNNMRKNDA